MNLVTSWSSAGNEVLKPRFIEYMDVGGATQWSMNQVVSRSRDHRNIESAIRPNRTRDFNGSRTGGTILIAGWNYLRDRCFDNNSLLSSSVIEVG